jgi:hypothetical protein
MLANFVTNAIYVTTYTYEILGWNNINYEYWLY